MSVVQNVLIIFSLANYERFPLDDSKFTPCLLGDKIPRCEAGLSTVANERDEGFVFPLKVLFQGIPYHF